MAIAQTAATEQEKNINLIALQRCDPCAEEILAQATQSALYRFNNHTQKWQKTETEGCMFVYRRSDKPWYSLVIMNRHSPSDYCEPIDTSIDFQYQPPYLFYRKDLGEIKGLWFYSKLDCERVWKLLSRLKADSEGNLYKRQQHKPSGGNTKSTSKADAAPPKTANEGNVLSMLNRAKQQYASSKGGAAESAYGLKQNQQYAAQSRNQQGTKNQQQQQASQEGLVTSGGLVKPTPIRIARRQLPQLGADKSASPRTLFVDIPSDGGGKQASIFAAADHSATALCSTPATAPPMPDMLQRLFGEPPTLTSSPKSRSVDDSKPPLILKGTLNASDLEKDLRMNSSDLEPSIFSGDPSRTPPSRRAIGSERRRSNEVGAVLPPAPLPVMVDCSLPITDPLLYDGIYGDEIVIDNSLNVTSATGGPRLDLLTPGDITGGRTSVPMAPLTFATIQQQQDQRVLFDLGGPTSVTSLQRNFSTLAVAGSSAAVVEDSQCWNPADSRSATTAAVDEDDTNEYSPNGKLVNGSDGEQLRSHVTPKGLTPLTKEQIVQAVRYLLQHDTGFVSQLHEAYVKSLNESLSFHR